MYLYEDAESTDTRTCDRGEAADTRAQVDIVKSS